MSKIVKIDNKYYNLEPKNRSFLLTAQELKMQGIKNWYFMLEVKYPQFNIEDVDIHDPDISPEVMSKVHLESKDNVWYWLRVCASIPAQGAPRPFQLILTRASAAVVWCYQHSIDVLLCQPRQTWKTTIALLITEYEFIYTLYNVKIPVMHIKEKECLRNVGMLRDYIECLPNWMNPFYGKKPPGLKSLKYDEHKTEISVISSADSEVNAKDKLRGYTLFGCFVDEWEFIPFIDSVLAGAAPAVISARVIARQTGGKTFMLYTSTPGDPETTTGKAALRIIESTPRWTEKYYDLTEEEISLMFEGMMKNEDGEDIQVTSVYIEYNYKQLRKDDKWLRDQYNEALSKGKLVEYRRGVLLDRSRDSSTSLFDEADIEYIKQNMKTPDYEILLIKKYVMYIYKHDVVNIALDAEYPYFDSEIPYMIGIDIATGSGGDNTAIVIVNPYTLDIVAELKSPYLGGSLDLMRCVTELAKLLPKAIFCPETNTVGKALLEFVQETNLEYRFFHDPRLDISKNSVIKETPEEKTKRLSTERGYIGTTVTPKVRETMFELLKMYLHDYREKIVSRFVVGDILTLVKTKTGRIEADPGDSTAHDDIIMAYLHILYVFTYGYDLTRFGIDKEKCTFEKSKQILLEYNEAIEANIVDNMKPYDHETIYEGQVLHDLTTENHTISGFDPVSHIDPYGYRRDQYHSTQPEYYKSRQTPQEEETLSASDVAFFYACNGF